MPASVQRAAAPFKCVTAARGTGYHCRFAPPSSSCVPPPVVASPWLPLQPHPQALASPARTLRVRAQRRTDGGLTLDFVLHADAARLRIPPPQPAGPADGLWQHTCFEAFVAAAGTPAYHEFNFSPSGQWAAYAFTDYRTRSTATVLPAPRLSWHRPAPGTDGDATPTLALSVELAAAALPMGADGPLHLGLCAVIEDDNGQHAWWALQHAAAHPDFHHRDGWVLHLPALLPTDTP